MNVEQLKLKHLLDDLDTYSGNGTSMITVSIPADGSIVATKKKLESEFHTSSEIKSRV